MKKLKTFIVLLSIPIVLCCQSSPSKIDSRNFTFTVIGDRTAGANQEVFLEIISSVKSMNTDFVINVGDLIEGYSQIESTINLEWDSIFDNLDALREKFYFTPGNHDIWDSLSKVIYLKRTGYEKPYYNFSLGKNHFVVFDNSLQEKIDNPDSAQLNWLVSTLAKYKKSDNIFCFIHKSFWKDAYAKNTPDTLHKLFIKYGVDYVFSGHDHYYCNLLWDGITYTQVGPSGSRLKEFKKEEFGAFQNFAMVSVKNNKVSIKVIKSDGTEMPADCVTLDDINELEEIEQAVIINPVDVGKSSLISVNIKNISSLPILSVCNWTSENKYWQIKPIEQTINILAKQTSQYDFSIHQDNESIYPLPRFNLGYPYASGKKSYQLQKLMPIALSAVCYKTNKAIKIDGKLNEKIWQKSKSIHIFGSGDGGSSPTDPWELVFAYDKANLYIGAKMTDVEPGNISTAVTERDEKVYNDDHINIILQPSVASDTYYQFFVNAAGAVLDRACYMQGKDSKKDAKWNTDIIAKGEVNTSGKFTGWTLEASIPLKNFPEYNTNAWGFNLVRFQKSKNAVSDFAVPFEHNPKTFAKLYFSK